MCLANRDHERRLLTLRPLPRHSIDPRPSQRTPSFPPPELTSNQIALPFLVSSATCIDAFTECLRLLRAIRAPEQRTTSARKFPNNPGQIMTCSSWASRKISGGSFRSVPSRWCAESPSQPDWVPTAMRVGTRMRPRPSGLAVSPVLVSMSLAVPTSRLSITGRFRVGTLTKC